MCLGSARGQVCARPSGEGVIIESEVLFHFRPPSPPTLAKGSASDEGRGLLGPEGTGPGSLVWATELEHHFEKPGEWPRTRGGLFSVPLPPML